MGVVANKKELAITSLNYSGILLSPFEFYSEDYWEDEQELSKCFRTLLTESVANFDPKTYKWGIGKIDKDLQRQRYSPLYQQQAGIINGKLIDSKKYEQIWDMEFQKHGGIMKTPPTPEERKNCRRFDLMVYESIIYFLYKQKNSEKAPTLDSKKYQNFMKKFFSKSFLNEEQKIQRTLKAMKQEEVDIFLVQQVTEELLSQIDRHFYNIVKSPQGNSAILLRKQKIKKYHNIQKLIETWPEALRKQILWNNNTAMCFVDNLIIFSFHLSSKKEKNVDQVACMLRNLKLLRQMYPMCDFVAGGDANSFIDPKQLQESEWHIFPSLQKDITTMKKRTWLQPQVNKAEQLAATCRDHLLTTLPQQNPRIVTIRGFPSSKVQYIPNQEHPCDHFVVSANITFYR